jgi:hypothetical protein
VAVIWSGGQTASDVFLLCAAIVAAIAGVTAVVARDLGWALTNAAVALVALGLLAL